VEEHRERIRKKDAKRHALKRQGVTLFKKKKLMIDEEERPDWNYRITEADYENVRGTWMYELL